ncbi:hypothetical protein J3R83DRAFT_13112 [Lanmaoa asiatica]|nr:hypothetical protein J3R83DRAFT_13112 [Lanmaoa asiatica]
MAPKPIEDIDFPALSDKILELLLALWAFVCDICTALWSYVSQAFWAVWTYPPFEAFRNEFIAALIALEEYVVAHPITTTAIFVLAYIVVPLVVDMLRIFFLHSLGFRRRDVLLGFADDCRALCEWILGSYPANYQSTSYGRNVPRG